VESSVPQAHSAASAIPIENDSFKPRHSLGIEKAESAPGGIWDFGTSISDFHRGADATLLR